MAGALIHRARHATFSRGAFRYFTMWRDGVSPVCPGARTRSVKNVVVGWATAESSASGCGADLNRMTSLHSRSSLAEPLAGWIRAWGSGEPVANDPAT